MHGISLWGNEMGINSDLAVLYQSWKRPGEQFVAGGVVDETEYLAAPCKMLVLLKEVNESDNRQHYDWSLVDLINDQIKTFKLNQKGYLEIWKRVGVLSLGLINEFNSYRLSTYIEDDIALGLSAIAVTNLKKSAGSGNSDHSAIKKYAERDKDLWIREIEIMGPDVIFCGGTFDIVQDILSFKIQKGPSGADYGQYGETVFVDFAHPMYRISPKIYYAYFIETMRELERIGAYRYMR